MRPLLCISGVIISFPAMRGCHAIGCWRGFEGVVDLNRVLTALGSGYTENRSFELTPHNVTALSMRTTYSIFEHCSHTIHSLPIGFLCILNTKRRQEYRGDNQFDLSVSLACHR